MRGRRLLGNLFQLPNLPCYQDCKWRFGVTGTINYCYGPCFNYTNVDANSIPNLPIEHCCAIVEDFIAGTGCADVGGIWYSNTNCLRDHEDFHYYDYSYKLAEGQADLHEHPALADMPCSEAASCQEAFNARQEAIIRAVKEVFDNAEVCDEPGAIAEARPCFMRIANEIIEYWFLTCEL
jgi:hypothetical protein